MTCPSSDILSRFADATLSDPEAVDLVAHLATCETCSRKVDELEHLPKQPVLTALRDLPNEQIADAGDPPLPRQIAQYEILEKIGQGGKESRLGVRIKRHKNAGRINNKM